MFLRPLEREFGWTRSELTSVYSIYLLVHGFTAPFVGFFFDRLGPRWVYGAGMASLAAAFLFAGSLSTLGQFYLLVGALVGVGVSLNGMVPGSALLSRWYRKRLSTALGIAFSAMGVGTIVFVPLAQHLVDSQGWRSTYRALGILVLVATPIVLALPWRRFAAGHPDFPHRKAGTGGEEGWTLRKAIRTPLYWGLVQLFFCTSISMFTVIVQLVAFFIDAGFSPLTAATAYGLVGMLSALSVMGSGWTSDRFGYRPAVTASFIGTAIGMALLVGLNFTPSMILLGLFVPIFGLCMGTRGPVVSAISARAFAGSHVATIYGTIYSSNAVGAAIGAFLGGVLHDLTGGYGTGFGVALFFIALASMPFWTIPALRDYR
ncbi:MAG: MFS transporter [Betaproteobacteria bacterium]|nr:MFS transporter [Betaproteobacteria bacterium]